MNRAVAAPAQPHTAPLVADIERLSLLDSLDLTQKLDKDSYQQQLIEEQARLSRLLRDRRLRKRGVLALFEGHDAAGKGSAIRRITGALDPRLYRTIQIAAPTEEERAQPWLWRFWRNVPERGKFTIFDRSWYGRVLVERVEGFCSPDDWLRAYSEINDFEEHLTDAGIVLVKFWLSIDKQTQLKRFKEREDTPFKRFKITEEDWRNRERWDDYASAVADMVDRTSTEIAPWTLVEANDKRFARVKVLRTLNEALEARSPRNDARRGGRWACIRSLNGRRQCEASATMLGSSPTTRPEVNHARSGNRRQRPDRPGQVLSRQVQHDPPR